MLSYLSQFEEFFGPLRLLRFITVRALLAAGTATVFGFIIAPFLIATLRALKFGEHYDDDRTGDLAARFDKRHTPTMGGLLLFLCVFFGPVLCAPPSIRVIVALLDDAALTAVGFRDDFLKV